MSHANDESSLTAEVELIILAFHLLYNKLISKTLVLCDYQPEINPGVDFDYLTVNDAHWNGYVPDVISDLSRSHLHHSVDPLPNDSMKVFVTISAE